MPQSTMRPSGAPTTPKTPHQLTTVSANRLVTQSGNPIQASK